MAVRAEKPRDSCSRLTTKTSWRFWVGFIRWYGTPTGNPRKEFFFFSCCFSLCFSFDSDQGGAGAVLTSENCGGQQKGLACKHQDDAIKQFPRREERPWGPESWEGLFLQSSAKKHREQRDGGKQRTGEKPGTGVSQESWCGAEVTQLLWPGRQSAADKPL